MREGLEVWLHWAGFFSGISKFRTDGKGRIFIKDDLINGSNRKATIYIQNPDGGLSLYFPDYVMTKGADHQLHLENAKRQ
ncbi:MAG: hypothetical protein CUN51_00275 [Candidatus Thermofonsia Clade 1 bacterium]|uniref:Uncharacterized protein n=1 Tax=Candidatus Thermofonsia Clade 1 bacterium TaxID=2364210 RepID=A0A2M8P3I7_9CHLR|nr:MAG: hypothetical protein CUN51_00275 [Candidatus Thermofonsia Clade 1 bacterium]